MSASPEEVDTSIGLSGDEAKLRLERDGPNEMAEQGRVPASAVLLRQFKDVLIFILVIAAAISLAIGELVDAGAILAIVVLNGVLGFVQEWRAEEALAALRKMMTVRARVLRDGREAMIDAREVVCGDVVILEIGEKVPADGRLVEANNLKVDESLLTGESAAVLKIHDGIVGDEPLAERTGEVFMSTVITNGWGKAVITATAMQTEIGKIAQLTQSLGDEPTPLQRKLAVVGKQLGVLGLLVSVGVAVAGLLRGKELFEMFLTGVALAVAVVPEGLPAVVTLTLALGVKAMVRRNALVRRLSSAEGLGAATVICTDKTGTLTQNEMTVRKIWTPNHRVDVSGIGYRPEGGFESEGAAIEPQDHADLRALLEIGLICNHASLQEGETGWEVIGEPTEGAIVVAAKKAHIRTPPITEDTEVIEFSFNSARKRMTVLRQNGDTRIAYTKGAPEVLVARSTHVLEDGQARAITQSDRDNIEQAFTAMAKSGLRTLGFATRRLPDGLEADEDLVEEELTFVGIVGILDPPREGVPEAIRLCSCAGIRVVMVTGDALPTAQAIAEKTGIPSGLALTGPEMDKLDDEALADALNEVRVFARVSPSDKVRIVSALQSRNHIVAMTGDGVNDAPALKNADVGISMGLRGTEVAKGAADMVLTDDNFISIVGAVEEGRREYDNIIKFVRYLLSSNTGEVVAILANIIIGGPLILLPVQILWMNLVTDGVTALALGLEPKEKDIMEIPPRDPNSRILSNPAIAAILILGGLIGVGTLGLFQFTLGQGGDVDRARTMAFTGIILLEKANVLNFRSMRCSLASLGFWTNPYLLGAIALNIVLQVLAVYTPLGNHILGTVALTARDWAVIFAVAAPMVLVGEAYKTFASRRGGMGSSGEARAPAQ